MSNAEFKMVPEPGTKKSADETEAYIHAFVKSAGGGQLTTTGDGQETLFEALERGAKEYGKMNFLGRITQSETIEYFTYERVWDLSKALGLFLSSVSIKEGSIVGICSENRPEWIVAEYATYFLSAINCPIYPSFGWSAVKHILKETEMEILFISQKNAEKFIGNIKGESADTLSLPRVVVIMDNDLNEETRSLLEERGVNVQLFWEVVEKFDAASKSPKKTAKSAHTLQSYAKAFKRPKPGTVATVCYTSGTTGAPKGAMLTHRNFVSVSGSFLALSRADGFFPISEENRYLSFLPLAHVFERVVESTLMLSRCTIIYYRGDPKQLQKDFSIAKPHYFVGVPRVFNSVKTAIETKAQAKGAFANFIFCLSVMICTYFKNWWIREMIGKVIFKEIRKTFGGSIQCMLSGSAPLTSETAEFFEAIFNCIVFEGYGQTETTAGNITTNTFTREKGVIGVPFLCNRVKLLSRPECNALVENNQGEILMQGPSIFLGYYKQDKLTREAFHKDSDATENLLNTEGEKWVKTGDIGEITEQGNIRIIGRCKEIFKLSQGEYIIPEKIENHFLTKKIPHLADFTVVGDSSKDYIIAICGAETLSESIKSQIEEAIKKEGASLVASGELIKIELPRKFIFTETLPTIDNGLLTPSGKKIRKKIQHQYGTEIDTAYKE
ncbi:long-chain acyl-CoA synthetase [Nematocida displodere]|uniref:Long-chain acyl-CoA synthetase n=1 Tax=Nematocida displodere TaxID=1805483 RepID=A0A177EAH5_9MICR|nr:long-chain acyl-CoA synthetase [Nematocida displodere]